MLIIPTAIFPFSVPINSGFLPPSGSEPGSWQVGDIAECINDEGWFYEGWVHKPAPGPREGERYRVIQVRQGTSEEFKDVTFLALDGFPEGKGYGAYCFRKVGSEEEEPAAPRAASAHEKHPAPSSARVLAAACDASAPCSQASNVARPRSSRSTQRKSALSRSSGNGDHGARLQKSDAHDTRYLPRASAQQTRMVPLRARQLRPAAARRARRA